MEKKLREFRNKANMTQKQLAEKIGISVISVRKYERGDRNHSVNVTKKICCIFKKKLEEVFPDIFSLY